MKPFVFKKINNTRARKLGIDIPKIYGFYVLEVMSYDEVLVAVLTHTKGLRNVYLVDNDLYINCDQYYTIPRNLSGVSVSDKFDYDIDKLNAHIDKAFSSNGITINIISNSHKRPMTRSEINQLHIELHEVKRELENAILMNEKDKIRELENRRDKLLVQLKYPVAIEHEPKDKAVPKNVNPIPYQGGSFSPK